MLKIIHVPFEKIKIKKRIRQEFLEIEALCQSIKKYGLFSPLLINQNYELLAGNRRYLALKELGWETLPVIMLDKSDDIVKLEIELEENIQRKDLNADELAHGFDKLDKLKNPSFWMRIWLFIKKLFKKIYKMFT